MKKKKKKIVKKGFTLIELLAVILVLGIIALIAVPQVTNVIENAHKGSAEVSAKHYLDAVNNKVALNKLDTDSSNDIADRTYNVGDFPVDISGELPESGTITITNGVVTAATLVVSGYTVTYDPNTGKCEATKGEVSSTRYVYGDGITDLTSVSEGSSERIAGFPVYVRYPVVNNALGNVEICIYDDSELCVGESELSNHSTVLNKVLNHYGYRMNGTTLEQTQVKTGMTCEKRSGQDSGVSCTSDNGYVVLYDSGSFNAANDSSATENGLVRDCQLPIVGDAVCIEY